MKTPTKYDPAWNEMLRKRHLKADLAALAARRPLPSGFTSDEALRVVFEFAFDAAIKWEQSRQRAIKKANTTKAARKR